jgi:hypothetical protein
VTRRLWLDASVARKPKVLSDLTELAHARGVEVTVHAHVHLELCRHLRCQQGPRFSQSFIDSYLAQRRIGITPMHVEQATAEKWAGRLHARYSTTEAWENAKLATLGGNLRSDFVHEPGRMPMTTDWWVALQVEDSEGDRIAVDDKGNEWDELRKLGRALESTEAIAWLESVAPQPP